MCVPASLSCFPAFFVAVRCCFFLPHLFLRKHFFCALCFFFLISAWIRLMAFFFSFFLLRCALRTDWSLSLLNSISNFFLLFLSASSCMFWSRCLSRLASVPFWMLSKNLLRFGLRYRLLLKSTRTTRVFFYFFRALPFRRVPFKSPHVLCPHHPGFLFPFTVNTIIIFPWRRLSFSTNSVLRSWGVFC